MAYKALIAVSGIAAGRAARQVTATTWKAATGGTPPVNKHDPNYSAAQVAVFTILASAIAGGFRAYAQRKASDYYTKSTGHLPPPVQKARQKAAVDAIAGKKGKSKH